MSKRADPKLVGGFVLGGVALVVAGLLIFGRGDLFARTRTVVAYFPGSVQGLRIGAPVAFQGVPIGQVSAITLTYDQVDQSVQIPVLMQVETDRVTVVRTDARGRTEDEIEALIKRGLRAQLQLESVVTGLLFVDLELQPDAPAKLYGSGERYLEIPTVPSNIQQLEESLDSMRKSVPELIDRANVLLARAEGILSPANAKAVSATIADLRSFVGVLASGKSKVQVTLSRLAEIAAAADATTRSLQGAAAEIEQIITDNKDQVKTLVVDLERAATAAMRMADQVNNMVAENRPGLQDFTSDTLYRLAGTLTDIQRLVDQLSRLAQNFEEDPSGFLTGDQTRGVRAR